MTNPEEDVAEIYDLERKLEILQQEAANMELDSEVLQNFVASMRKKVAATKVQTDSVIVRQKADAGMLPNLESATATLTKFEIEVKSHPLLADDMEKLGIEFGQLMKLHRRAEIDKCMDPMNEFLDTVVGESGRWKFLETQSLGEQTQQEELRVQIGSAKEEMRALRTDQLKGRKVMVAQVLHLICDQKRTIDEFNETMRAMENLQKTLDKLDLRAERVQKRIDRPKKRLVEEAILMPETPEKIAPPLKLAPVDLTLDNFKDPNECLAKTVAAKNPLPDTPRPSFKSTGSYGALLPKILQMDKLSKSIQKKRKAVKTSAAKLFVWPKKPNHDSLGEPQPLADETPGQAPVSSSPKPAEQELVESVVEEIQSPTPKEPETVNSIPNTSPRKSQRLAKKQAKVQLKSPPPDIMNQAADILSTDDDPGTASIESPTNDKDPAQEISAETIPECQATDYGQAENPTNEQENEEELPITESIQSVSPTLSAPTRNNLEVDNFLDLPIVELPQTETVAPLPTKFDLILDNSGGSGAWDMGSNNGANNLFGSIGSPTPAVNAKGDASNGNDFDFFASTGGDEPNDFFGNTNDDNRVHHLSLF